MMSCGHVGIVTSKATMQTIRSSEPQRRRSSPKFGWNIEAGSLFSAKMLRYLWKGARQEQGYYWWSIGSRTRALDWYQNQPPWTTIADFLSKYVRFLSPPRKFEWPTLSARRCSPMTLVPGNIRFMRIFVGFVGKERQTTVGWRRFSVLSGAISSKP